MTWLGWLLLGLLVGWLVELVIDYVYWRKQARIAAVRLAERDAALVARSEALDRREAALGQRDQELADLQATLTAKDADLLAQARRIEERGEELTRQEQATEKRRADLDRMGLTLNERDKDVQARLDTLKVKEADLAARLEKLERSENDVARRVAAVSNRESAMQSWETRILSREHEVADREAELARQAATAAAHGAGFAAMKQLMQKHYREADGSDNLQVIEGVGPKIAELLKQADIRSFERLAETSVGELSRILESGGPRFGLANPMSWAEQAGLLADGDFVGFESLKAELVGGVRREAAAVAESGGTEPPAGDSVVPAGEGPAGEGPAGDATAEAGPAVIRTTAAPVDDPVDMPTVDGTGGSDSLPAPSRSADMLPTPAPDDPSDPVAVAGAGSVGPLFDPVLPIGSTAARGGGGSSS